MNDVTYRSRGINMQNDNENNSTPNDNPDFDFDEWMELNKTDPEAFELKRKELIDEVISSAPEKYQRRLKGISFQVDAIRARAKNPMQSCIEISKMMNDSIMDLQYFLKDLKYTVSGQESEPVEPKQSADVLDFLKK